MWYCNVVNPIVNHSPKKSRQTAGVNHLQMLGLVLGVPTGHNSQLESTSHPDSVMSLSLVGLQSDNGCPSPNLPAWSRDLAVFPVANSGTWTLKYCPVVLPDQNGTMPRVTAHVITQNVPRFFETRTEHEIVQETGLFFL